MKKILRLVMVLLISMIMASGCSNKTEDEAVSEAKEMARTVFELEAEIEANEEVNGLPLYIPGQLDVQSEEENNLILEDGNQTYLVFYNVIEDTKSKLNYESAQSDNTLILETFEDNEKFGYIRILPKEEEGYELQVGVGGVKITTYTTKRKMADDTEEMMKMAKYMAFMDH
ncbi:hypothetical protein [Oceanobacillus halophilus]|uniref:DUF4367 domain-containing protein n=1 Tax=Oceanobacillus halophilus TaxID=930130 RepID=A0A494ZVT9_9BACI|nr:hypothetical protein [Oceanobacillus halophilus]RKQ30526.1 hypothetical protein D8M06_15620 [Oceanobacillus halophilus]